MPYKIFYACLATLPTIEKLAQVNDWSVIMFRKCNRFTNIRSVLGSVKLLVLTIFFFKRNGESKIKNNS